MLYFGTLFQLQVILIALHSSTYDLTIFLWSMVVGYFWFDIYISNKLIYTCYTKICILWRLISTEM
jgi:hypothetical protein